MQPLEVDRPVREAFARGSPARRGRAPAPASRSRRRGRGSARTGATSACARYAAASSHPSVATRIVLLARHIQSGLGTTPPDGDRLPRRRGAGTLSLSRCGAGGSRSRLQCSARFPWATLARERRHRRPAHEGAWMLGVLRVRTLIGLAVLLVVAYAAVSWIFSDKLLATAERPLGATDPAAYGLPKPDVVEVPGDGVKLSSWYFANPRNEHCAVIMLHGFGGARGEVVAAAPIFWRRGCDLLLYDSRGHGTSSPALLTFGVHERQDLRLAIAWLAPSHEAPRPEDRPDRLVVRGCDGDPGGRRGSGHRLRGRGLVVLEPRGHRARAGRPPVRRVGQDLRARSAEARRHPRRVRPVTREPGGRDPARPCARAPDPLAPGRLHALPALGEDLRGEQQVAHPSRDPVLVGAARVLVHGAAGGLHRDRRRLPAALTTRGSASRKP